MNQNNHRRIRLSGILEILLALATAAGAYFAGRQAYATNKALENEIQTPVIEGVVQLTSASNADNEYFESIKGALLSEFLQSVATQVDGEEELDYVALIQSNLPISAEIPPQDLVLMVRLSNSGPVPAGRTSDLAPVYRTPLVS